MTADLTRTILGRAYELDSERLDAQARRLGSHDWKELTAELVFGECATGGGCLMLTSPLPDGYRLGVTAGEADLPTTADRFWVAVMDEEDEEVVDPEAVMQERPHTHVLAVDSPVCPRFGRRSH